MEQISNRMPRPEGTTFLCREVHRARSQKAKLERKNRLLNHLVNVYTMAGFRINGHSLNLAQFSNLLGVKQEKIQSILFDKAHTIQAFSDPDTLKDTANALAGMCTTWAIQDRGLLQQQVDMLLRSQGNKYKPFITAEVTRALQTLMASNKNVAEIFKTFYSQGGININMTQNQLQQENVLTIDKAYEIVKETTPQIEKVTDHKQAQILSPEVLKQIQENNTLPDPALLRMFEHLDTSGWEKGRTLPNHSPQTRKNLQKAEEAIVLEETDNIPLASDQLIGIDNTGDAYKDQDPYGSSDSNMGIDSDAYKDAPMSQLGSDSEVSGMGNVQSEIGKDRKQPAALEKGSLPGPSQPSSPRAQSLSGTSPAAITPIYTASEGNQGTSTQRPTKVPKKKKKAVKPHTLYGSKLGCKVPQQPSQQGTQTNSPEPSQDNLDRHLKAHLRRGTTEPFPSQIPDSPTA